MMLTAYYCNISFASYLHNNQAYRLRLSTRQYIGESTIQN